VRFLREGCVSSGKGAFPDIVILLLPPPGTSKSCKRKITER
jgi:hypothetical protein